MKKRTVGKSSSSQVALKSVRLSGKSICLALSLHSSAFTFMLVGETENRAVEITAPICMQFFVLSVVLPMVFKFGVERGRVYMIVAAVALMAVLIAVFPLLEDMQEGGTIFIICACVFTVVAICVSFLASLKIYKSKEF